jgi:N-acetylneuraminate synthase
MTAADDRVYVIAEAGVNHNGDLGLAHKLVEIAADAGADAVKFQTFRAEAVVATDAPKAGYQKETTGADESQLAMLRRLELPTEAHHALRASCRARGVDFLSTPFDRQSLDFLTGELGLETIKVPSGEITNGPLLLAAARSARKLIVSTGMSTLDDVREALGVIAFGFVRPADTQPSRQAFADAFADTEGQRAVRERVVLLHCTSQYPAPEDEINLRAMATMRDAFAMPVGLSDHSAGIAVPIAAAALGARVIEKHFTADRALPGPDHRASLEPAELATMIAGIRTVERALGDGVKAPTASEADTAAVARRSLAATTAIAAGATFGEANLGTLRPGTGISPMAYWDWLGRTAADDVPAGSLLRR